MIPKDLLGVLGEKIDRVITAPHCITDSDCLDILEIIPDSRSLTKLVESRCVIKTLMIIHIEYDQPAKFEILQSLSHYHAS